MSSSAGFRVAFGIAGIAVSVPLFVGLAQSKKLPENEAAYETMKAQRIADLERQKRTLSGPDAEHLRRVACSFEFSKMIRINGNDSEKERETLGKLPIDPSGMVYLSSSDQTYKDLYGRAPSYASARYEFNMRGCISSYLDHSISAVQKWNFQRDVNERRGITGIAAGFAIGSILSVVSGIRAKRREEAAAPSAGPA